MPELINNGDGVQVTGARRVTPGKQAMTAEHDAVASAILLHRLAQHQGEFEARPQPGQPDQPMVKALIEFLHLLAAIGSRGERDTPVGMKMVNVGEGQEAVQGRIDGSGDSIVTESAKRIQRNHLVFMGCAAITPVETAELLQVERGKALARDASQVAATAFDP